MLSDVQAWFEAERNAGRVIVLDGGLATELEARGYPLNDPLWSARVLAEHPEAIGRLHFDYFVAGAQIVITATYQATFTGLLQRGWSASDAASLFIHAVDLAIEARTAYRSMPWMDPRHAAEDSPLLVAASIGPYGAFLHDGSEFRGDYGLRDADLADFHRARLDLLARSRADLLACETIPCLQEAEVLARLLRDHPQCGAWFTFSCRDGTCTCHGEPLRECARRLDDHPQILALGINCTRPEFVTSLITEARRGTAKPIIVYPNSGETWDAERRVWNGTADVGQFIDGAASWRDAGATLIGGCCRTGPEHIRQLRRRLRAVGTTPPSGSDAL